MIWYVVTEQHAYTMKAYLKTWGQSLAGRISEVTYDELLCTTEFKALPGTYIFSDIERLHPPDAQYFAMIRQKILEQQPEALEMREQCEKCERALDEQGEAHICSYECTFCGDCSDAMSGICPNCGGELLRRPRRAAKA